MRLTTINLSEKLIDIMKLDRLSQKVILITSRTIHIDLDKAKLPSGIKLLQVSMTSSPGSEDSSKKKELELLNS